MKIILPVIIVLLLALAGMGYAWNRYAGRPICFPQLPPRGDDPPKVFFPLEPAVNLPIPTQNDWMEFGPVLETGAEGEWDFFWAGLTPASVVKKDDTYFFYYVAADGYRSHDGDARHRSVGVATSPDGIRFTKYDGNPIMTHRPHDGEEEGANSAGVTLDKDGRFVMVYGAAAGPADLIVADARYAFSDDGLSFSDVGQALYHCNIRLYGWGDEVFPIAVFHHKDRLYVYYQPNGIRGTERTLGVAWGPSLDRLNNSTKVLGAESGGLPVDTWGNIIQLDDDTLVFFNQRLWWPDTYVEVRVASPETPYHLSEPVARYDIPNLKRGVFFLDKERRTWFMYYNDFSHYWNVKLAPYGPHDTTPPTAPRNLVASATTHDTVKLSWEPAQDADTGVVEYRVYRDSLLAGNTKRLEWVDIGLEEGREFSYKVSAVNFHRVEGPADNVSAKTPIDRSPPAITSVWVSGDLNQVGVTFDKSLDPSTATDLAHYSISNGIIVFQALLENNQQTVILETSTHIPGSVYTLTVSGILDLARKSDTLISSSRFYTASPVNGLVGRWLSNSYTGNSATDVSGFGWDGHIYGAVPEINTRGGLFFNGSDDYIQIPGDGHLQHLTESNFTMSLMVRPESILSSVHDAPIFIRVGGHPAYFYGISFTNDQRFQALVFHPDETRSIVTTSQVSLGKWYHVVMVVDEQTRKLKLFLDGETVPNSPQQLRGDLIYLWSDPPRDDRSGAYFIGSTMPDRGAGSFFTAYFHGAIADVRLYDHALKPLEIQLLWQEQQQGHP
jgi:hypothetical protein